MRHFNFKLKEGIVKVTEKENRWVVMYSTIDGLKRIYFNSFELFYDIAQSTKEKFV